MSRSDTCEGHYCFVSLTTTEIALLKSEDSDPSSNVSFVGLEEGQPSSKSLIFPKYEILVGCLKIDDDKVIV